MLCEECHENEAEVLITEVDTEGSLKEKHLCKSCADKKGYLSTKQKSLAESFSDFLSERGAVEEEKTKCASCGLSWADFRRQGKFGCEKCYESFGELSRKMILRIQGTTRHAGRKAPKKREDSPIYKEKELERLREDLKKAIEDEEYEKAAKIRDDLKKYEKWS